VLCVWSSFVDGTRAQSVLIFGQMRGGGGDGKKLRRNTRGMGVPGCVTTTRICSSLGSASCVYVSRPTDRDEVSSTLSDCVWSPSSAADRQSRAFCMTGHKFHAAVTKRPLERGARSFDSASSREECVLGATSYLPPIRSGPKAEGRRD
jgi:hypothetical protein